MLILSKVKNSLIKTQRKIPCVLSIFLFILSTHVGVVFAQVESRYYWPSGYKFRTDPAAEGSVDPQNSFMGIPIIGGEFNNDYIEDLYARFPVSQSNWAITTGCRTCVEADLNVSMCQGDGDTISADTVCTYECTGDVSYTVDIDNSVGGSIESPPTVYGISGGDTTYGAWSMLLSFFPPADVNNCNLDGRCFVGNAFILDTKAQNEEHPGLVPGFGIKELVGAPGEIYYFDQVRAMTQPPVTRNVSFNNPYLVGEMIQGLTLGGGGTGECDGSIFESQLGSQIINYSWAVWAFNETIRLQLETYPELLEAYAAAEEATGVPCEIMAGIHMMEGMMDPTASLYDGGSIRGGSLVADAIGAAGVLVNHMQGLSTDFWGYVQGLTSYNGYGNLNCRADDKVPGDPCYDVTCATGYVPTRWRCGGKCSTGMHQYDDSMYALSWIDERHGDMDIIFCSNGVVGTCDGFCQPYPDPKQGPGALTTAFMVHEYFKTL